MWPLQEDGWGLRRFFVTGPPSVGRGHGGPQAGHRLFLLDG